MALIGKLTALRVERSRTPGMYGDGGGLYLQVTGVGAKSWIFRYWVPERDRSTGELRRDPRTGKVRGKSREMGLGSLSVVSLAEARNLASEYRRSRQQGSDPLEARRQAKEQAALEKAQALTFKKAAEAYIAAHRAGWRNAKHAAQWGTTLATYADPLIGALPVQAIDTALIMKVLEQDVCSVPDKPALPLWSAKPETASRLRGRIESILDWATVRGFRKGENPARWRGHLDKLLPARAKVKKVKHHAALPFAELPAFLTQLGKQEGVAARALEFSILTAARTGESIGATWSELDHQQKVWIVPAARMKAGKEHRVPLSTRALTVLDGLKAAASDTGEYVFAGGKPGQPLSNMAMLAVLQRMDRADLTVHGFRSTFRDWAAECTTFPSEVVEMALAHAVGDKVEAAYRRGDLFEKRRRLMHAWAEFCNRKGTIGKVLQIRRPRSDLALQL